MGLASHRYAQAALGNPDKNSVVTPPSHMGMFITWHQIKDPGLCKLHQLSTDAYTIPRATTACLHYTVWNLQETVQWKRAVAKINTWLIFGV